MNCEICPRLQYDEGLGHEEEMTTDMELGDEG